jgi:hypothetical protein
MIKAEMAKHEESGAKVRANFASQGKLLPAIVAANAKCSSIRQAATGTAIHMHHGFCHQNPTAG